MSGRTTGGDGQNPSVPGVRELQGSFERGRVVGVQQRRPGIAGHRARDRIDGRPRVAQPQAGDD